MPKNCDNKSVGVIIQNPEGEVALLRRAKFPVGMAPVAGHVDEHGSPEQAAIDEAAEEVGLHISLSGLRSTIIQARRVNNQCRRPGGDFHEWSVYEVNEFTGTITPDPDETKGANWCPPEQLQAFANRTKAYQAGEISEEDWQANPGLEEIWLEFFTELGYVR